MPLLFAIFFEMQYIFSLFDDIILICIPSESIESKYFIRSRTGTHTVIRLQYQNISGLSLQICHITGLEFIRVVITIDIDILVLKRGGFHLIFKDVDEVVSMMTSVGGPPGTSSTVWKTSVEELESLLPNAFSAYIRIS
ncbi:unnamed protein product [Oppiella nova]|uniref:Uncharacterized protein n=1 Tax=Oppiella nova TaxID=334625 RepID=A0A7R9QKN6_9ACAR|nr:unnamed protein product [Oppiella nova]CAG2167771.1 unnamed protein product [Oppiella nova]